MWSFCQSTVMKSSVLGSQEYVLVTHVPAPGKEMRLKEKKKKKKKKEKKQCQFLFRRTSVVVKLGPKVFVSLALDIPAF